MDWLLVFTLFIPLLPGVVVGLLVSIWARDERSRLLQALRALGMTRIVVQWSVDGTTAYYPSRHFRIGPMPPLETLLDLAEAAGMHRTFVGQVERSGQVCDRITELLARPRAGVLDGEAARLPAQDVFDPTLGGLVAPDTEVDR